MSGANNTFTGMGPTPGIGLGTTNYKNPFTGGGQPSTVAVPNQPQGASMPKGWNSGILGNTSLTPNTSGTPNTLTPGLLDQYKSPAPVKKLVSASGDEVHFDNTPQGGTAGTSTTNTSTTTPATPATPTTPVGAIAGQLVGMGSQPGTAYTNENNAANQTLGQLQNLETLQADRTMGINNSGKGLPWATGTENQLNIATSGQEQALAGQYQGEVGQLGAANTQQGLQQGALGTAGGLVSPQPYGITTTPYQPATNTFGTLPGGANGATEAGIVQGQLGVGQQYAQNSAILGKVQSQLPGLQAAMQKDNFNPTDVTYLNQLQDWAKGTLSDSAIPEVQGSLNDIVGGLSQVLGVPSSGGSDFRLQFAGSIVNALQSGQSIQQAVQFATNQAIAGNQGYLAGAQGATNPANQNSAGTVSAGGYNFTQDSNGNWVAQ